jgi:hypothetical protein
MLVEVVFEIEVEGVEDDGEVCWRWWGGRVRGLGIRWCRGRWVLVRMRVHVGSRGGESEDSELSL